MAQQALRLDALGEDVDAFWVDEGPAGSGAGSERDQKGQIC